jgi:hypothetical protein
MNIPLYKRWFCFSAGVILLLTGIAKIWSAFGHAKVLAVQNPLLEIQFGHLMIGVGAVELAVAIVCFFSRSTQWTVGCVAWLATNFLLYRFGNVLMNYREPCSCLGNLTDALRISPHVADIAMKIVLAYLFIGSYAILFGSWWQCRKTSNRQ